MEIFGRSLRDILCLSRLLCFYDITQLFTANVSLLKMHLPIRKRIIYIYEGVCQYLGYWFPMPDTFESIKAPVTADVCEESSQLLQLLLVHCVTHLDYAVWTCTLLHCRMSACHPVSPTQRSHQQIWGFVAYWHTWLSQSGSSNTARFPKPSQYGSGNPKSCNGKYLLKGAKFRF